MSVERFKRKCASFASVFPSVAGPAVGGFAGRVIGSRFKQPDLGMLLGSITGGTTGQLLKEKAEDAEAQSDVPPGAPYALDPTDRDIPMWALQGAHVLQPHMKRGSHEGVKDVVLGDLGGPIYPLAQGIKNRDIGGAMKGILGQGAGVLGGGLAGHGAGLLLDKLVGHQVNVPGVNIPLSTLLSGLGATIGSVKGLDFARK
jgi:hypothetical protein